MWGTGGQVISVDVIRWWTHSASNNMAQRTSSLTRRDNLILLPTSIHVKFLCSTRQHTTARVQCSSSSLWLCNANQICKQLYSLAVAGTVHPLTNTGERLGACVSVGRVRVLSLSCRCRMGRGGGGVTNTGNGAATARDSAGNGPTTEVNELCRWWRGKWRVNEERGSDGDVEYCSSCKYRFKNSNGVWIWINGRKWGQLTIKNLRRNGEWDCEWKSDGSKIHINYHNHVLFWRFPYRVRKTEFRDSSYGSGRQCLGSSVSGCACVVRVGLSEEADGREEGFSANRFAQHKVPFALLVAPFIAASNRL